MDEKPERLNIAAHVTPATASREMQERMINEEIDRLLDGVFADFEAQVAREFPTHFEVPRHFDNAELIATSSNGFTFCDVAAAACTCVVGGVFDKQMHDETCEYRTPPTMYAVLMNGERFDHRLMRFYDAAQMRRRVEALWPDAIVEIKEIEQ